MSDAPTRHSRAEPRLWTGLAAIAALLVLPLRAAHAEETAADDTPAAPSPAPAPAKVADDADSELSAEDEAAMSDEDDPKLKRPPSKGKGALWGIVKDTKFNEGVIEAQVQVVGRKQQAIADVNGGYRLELPPGKYSLRVWFELYRPTRVENVEVKAGEVTRIDFQLVPDETAVEEVVVEEQVELSSNEGQNLGRKRSAVVGDGVGRAEIAHTPDRNAAEAAQRVVGATIVNNRFVYVRGLGERYTNALLNGAPLPSTEPDRNTVPLDLFPSLVLDNLTIVKQFTPDMPADFAGGSVRITTREFPKQPLFQISAYGAFNTQTTLRSMPNYYGSSREWLGFDGGRRAFPSGIPDHRIDPNSTDTPEERALYAHKLNSAMGTSRKIAPPNSGFSIVAGDAYKLNATTKLGAMLALTYGRSYQLREITTRTYFMDPLPDGTQSPIVGDEFHGRQSIDSVRWGAFGSVALEHERNTTLRLVAFHSQSADDLTSEQEGTFKSTSSFFHANHLEYVSRGLNFVQLGGEHHYPKLKELEIDWHVSLATADRDQPDTRETRYGRGVLDGVDGWRYSGASGTHSFITQSDDTRTFGLDVLQPIIQPDEHRTSIKAGLLVTSRRRDFRARRFRLEAATKPGPIYDALSFCPGRDWDSQCPNRLFRREAIRSDGLQLNEATLNFDQYASGLDVYGFYAMVDTKPTTNLRAVAGVRGEITYQAFSGFDPFDRAGTEQHANIYQTDWLPAASLVYATSAKSNARLGVSQTLARPQLREVSPARATSYSGDISVQGNPDLVLTKITNIDLRYELFPTLREVLAFSLFYKHFSNPIEESIISADVLSFVNAPQANLYGAEIEGRKTLDILTPALRDFTLIANLTLVKSIVDLGNATGQSNSSTRQLSYQSPYVVNLSLDYENDKTGTDARALYNVFGPRITAVGSTIGLPDTYELPRHQLDLSAAQKLGKRFQLKAQAQNVLAAPIVFAYRNQPAYRKVDHADGSRTFESLGRSPAVSRYNPGATFTLSATYTY
jgi:TonB-dependent receptor